MHAKNMGIGTVLQHPKFGKGVIVNMQGEFIKIYFQESEETRELSKDFDGFEILEAVENVAPSISLEDVELALENVLFKMNMIDEPVKMGDKWLRGKIMLIPGNQDTQEKEIPIDVFFNKIIMIRDRLRVLEQNVNSHPKLDNEDKIHLQQYITRCYGSLTTFNVLFKDKYAHFKGEGKND